ncbi:MAG: glycosyl hydrolase-related protein [Methylacidiphilales bacterium]|nr:glycosyl hydrolase-related protein [Candidatus Methylacidiphilales bacterium]
MSQLPEILVIPHNHFDPTWRRCFDRPADYHGVRVRSYAEIEDMVLSRSFELSAKGFTQSEGQIAIWRKYLERHPKALAKIRKEVREKRLCFPMAGETVQDSNLPTAEGLVRNFLVAMPLYRKLCGEDHEGLKIAWVEDMFGISPNYPQILKNVGTETLWRVCYRICHEEVMVGIDGTKILCMDHLPQGALWSFVKHPPCPECKGRGCAACDHTGIVLMMALTKSAIMTSLESTIQDFLNPAKPGPPEEKPPGVGGEVSRHKPNASAAPFFVLGGEEDVVSREAVKAVREIAEKYRGKVKVRFGTFIEIYLRERDRLHRVLREHASDQPHDLNPVMPGCYVSRIKVKQRTRAISHLLTTAESILANQSWAAKKPVPQPGDLNLAWQRVAFCQFHDAITGTHIDSAAVEITDMLDEAEKIARRHVKLRKAAPLPKLKPASKKSLPREVTWGPFQIRFDLRGITQILTQGRDLFDPFAIAKTIDKFRIGELSLESDYGDAWGQRISPLTDPAKNYSRRPLGEYHDRVEIGDDAILWHGSYKGGHKKVKTLKWTTRVELSDDGRRLNFSTGVDWDTESKRLRVLFPVASQEKTATYEVPFGFIDRRYDASKLDFSQWNADQREFAIQNWIHKKIDAVAGVALLVKGLPCVRWLPRLLELSLVRSPEWEFCTVEPVHYEFWDIDGVRDTGRHHFEYSLWPHAGEITTTQLTREGLRYNRPEFQAPPFHIHGNVAVTAWKPAENGKGWILRLQETLGRGTGIKIEFGRTVQITPCDLLERPNGNTSAPAPVWQGKLHRHGILTLRLE